MVKDGVAGHQFCCWMLCFWILHNRFEIAFAKPHIQGQLERVLRKVKVIPERLWLKRFVWFPVLKPVLDETGCCFSTSPVLWTFLQSISTCQLLQSQSFKSLVFCRHLCVCPCYHNLQTHVVTNIRDFDIFNPHPVYPVDLELKKSILSYHFQASNCYLL